ncbi:Zn-ribbon domain-containing OB-fold protein [Rhodococcus opacus]|uniref:Zn-ribbon domain-containing OB-fold protein n=1 Tax=Rhodococcus opacus TaxID=37919 RepID=UPI001C47C911|nr:OB-fold domain-containing protein [Rhodococcus opacus]MBV6761768.1 OB-fold domain-containing protein [Rhodococcus opacus]
MKSSYGDRDSGEWWQALVRRELLVQRCSCGTLRWAPRAMCNACGSFDWAWLTTAGTGSVVSWTVARRGFSPSPVAPFTVVLARLSEGPNLIVPGGWAGDIDASDLSVGMRVRADFTAMDPAKNAPTALITWSTDQAT